MEMKLYSVYDKVMKEFAPPFVAKNDDVAVRNYINGAKRIPNINDLQLFCLGVWNSEDLECPYVPSSCYEVPVNFGGENV